MMTLEAQAELLIKTFPHLKKCHLTALSASGIFWVTATHGIVYKVWDNKAEKISK